MKNLTNEERKWCVYVHINKINGKMYVGQTCMKPTKRWNGGRGYKTQIHFYNAIQKYGWDNFDHEIIASNLTKKEANKFEILLIDKLDTTNINKGYNLTKGGEGFYGFHHSEETKKKISKSTSGKNHHLYGKHRSEEIRYILSEAHKGHFLSEETKVKISEAHKGKHMPKEVRQKISESVTRVKQNKAKKVSQYDKEGNLIKVWDNIKQVQEELQVTYSAINACCRGKHKTSCGFVWKYTEVA